MSNIAEGFERRTSTEFARFLVIAKASAGEVRSQLYVALDLEYVDTNTFNAAYKLAETTSRMIAGLTSYLKSSKASPAEAVAVVVP